MNSSKENKKYDLTPLEKRFVKIYLALAVFYSVITIYLLNTAIDEWVFNLGQYNTQLLEMFPKAQYWVNISVAYREKMIPLYVLYQGIFWFVFITTIGIFVKDWAWYKQNLIYRVQPRARTRTWLLLFMTLLIVGLLYFLVFDESFGSNSYMVYEELTKTNLHNDVRKWNKMSFLIYRLFGIFSPFLFIYGLTLSIAGFIFAFKQKFNKKGEK